MNLHLLSWLLAVAAIALGSGENCGFYKFKIGELSAATISDGPLEAQVSNLAAAAPIKELRSLLEDAFLPTGLDDVLQFQQNALYLEVEDYRCLFDTGSMGFLEVFPKGGQLVTNLRAMGVEPEDINCVIISHGHVDHIGGIQEFPNAVVYFNKEEYRFWSGPEASFREAVFPPEIIDIFVELQRQYLSEVTNEIRFFEMGEEIIPGVTAFAAPGHTEFHANFKIRSAGVSAMFAGDSIVFCPVFCRRPDLTAYFDNLGDVAIETRVELLGKLADEKELLISFHDNFPGVFYVREDRVGRDVEYNLVPVVWSQNSSMPAGP